MTGTELALLGGEPVVTEPTEFIWPPVTEQEITDVVALMRRGELSYYGREGAVASLEDKFKDYFGVKYALAVSSGTTALHSAYFGIGIGPGDEVLAPTYTFLATVMPIWVANGFPVLVDAEADTGNICVDDIEQHITPRTKAIVVTHMWGHPCDIRAIVELARHYKLFLIEDCSHAHGAMCDNQKVGTFGDIGIFSLQAKKLVSAGQGGILISNNQEIYERATLLGHFKVRSFQEVKSAAYRQYASTGYGLNYRMHPLGAAMANAQFDCLEDRIAARHRNLDYLSKLIAQTPGIHPPIVKPYVTRHAMYSYKPLYSEEELGGLPIDLYVAALRAEGVSIERSETIPLHREPLFQTLDDGMLTYGRADSYRHAGTRRVYSPRDFPGSQKYQERALVLPPYTEECLALMDQFAAAFEKVAANVPALLAYSKSMPANTSRAKSSAG